MQSQAPVRSSRLDAAAESELLERAQQGDSLATTSLLQALEPFVLRLALEYRRYGLPLDDIAQEGRIGLLKAITRFDASKAVRLSTYAAYWIRAEIREYVVRAYRMTRIGGSKGDRRALRYYRRTREQNPDRLALAAGISVERAAALLPLLMSRDVQLDAHDREEGHPLLERLAGSQKDPEQLYLEQEARTDERSRLRRALGALAPREREIVLYRFLAEQPMTLEEVGKVFGISKERVRQLEERAKGRIRHSVSKPERPLAA